MPQPLQRSLPALLLLAVMWGLSIPVTKLGLLTMTPSMLTTLRFAIAVPLMLLCAAGRLSLPWGALPRVVGLGALGIGVGQVTQTYGVDGTSASVGTIISATIPVFIVFFAALRLKQPVSGRQKLGLAAAFAGIALVAVGSGPAQGEAVQSSAVGAACLLLSAVAIAFYWVWSVELAEEYGTATVAAWSSLAGLAVLLPWASWQEWHDPGRLTSQGLGAAVYLGVVVTVAGLFLWLRLLRTVPARVAAGVQYLQPVVGVAAAAAMFGESLGIFFAAGSTLVLGGLALTVKSQDTAAPSA